MKTRKYLSKTLGLIVLVICSLNSVAQPCKEVVGYYPNWQWYDRNKLVNPQSIDYSKYSIINYCFFVPEANGSISSHDAWADENLLLGEINWSTGGYVPGTSIVFNAHANGVKILPSIGGWTLSSNFPGIAADPVKRSTFANACVNLIQTYGFDGIDLDWEYPGFAPHNGTPQDKTNFNLLLAEVRTAIDAYGVSIGKPMLLTAAVGATDERMQQVDWPIAGAYLDIINVMSYDFFGTWDPVTNHNAPLDAPSQGDPYFNLSTAIDKLINDYNVDPLKITAGVAFYGRSVKTTGPAGLHVPHTGGVDLTTFPEDEGTPLYYNTLLKSYLFDEAWDANAKVPYLTGKNGLNTFLSYDNEQSIELKAQFMVEQGIRGAIIWEITGDYVETSPGSGIISETPLATKLNSVFCNYVPSTAGVQESSSSAPEFVLFPNPASNMVTIRTPHQGTILVRITDSKGLEIRSFALEENRRVFSVDGVPSGVYHAELIGDFQHNVLLLTIN